MYLCLSGGVQEQRPEEHEQLPEQERGGRDAQEEGARDPEPDLGAAEEEPADQSIEADADTGAI